MSSEAVVSLEGIDRGEIVSDALIAELGAAIEEKTEQLIFADGTGNDIDGLGKSGVILAPPTSPPTPTRPAPPPRGWYKHIVDLGTVVSGARKVRPDACGDAPQAAQRHAEGDHHGHQQRAGVPQRPAARRGHEGAYPLRLVPTDLGTADDQDIVYAFVGTDLALVRSPLYVAVNPVAKMEKWQVVVKAVRYVALHARHSGAGIASVTGTVFDADSAAVE